jgi:hypothetical protein
MDAMSAAESTAGSAALTLRPRCGAGRLADAVQGLRGRVASGPGLSRKGVGPAGAIVDRVVVLRPSGTRR